MIRSVAVVFDNSLRPETTGFYVRRALAVLVESGRLLEVEHFLPAELPHLSSQTFDLTLFIDDGLDYVIPPQSGRTSFWAIDTHLSFERCLGIAARVDQVFAAQKRGVLELQQAGIKTVSWLPLACDLELHGSGDIDNQYDIAFVGHEFPGRREECLNIIRQKFPRHFIGQCYFREMANVYSASHVAFNCSLSDDLNMRVFEGLASGALLVTNDLPAASGLGELFVPGVDFLTYRNLEDLASVVEEMLKDQDRRLRIASSGQAKALSGHTYRHRVEQILDTLDQSHIPQRGCSSTAMDQRVFAKSASYFEMPRPDVLDLVPAHSKQVLDIGCGAGWLGKQLKARQPGIHVEGIEREGIAATRANQVLDRVHLINLDSEEFAIPDRSFDCVVCADVLEHLRDPKKTLNRIYHWLKDRGTLIISIPNSRHHSILSSLLDGNWTYESAGLLDEDHVRVLTLREMRKLLYRANFEIQEIRAVPGSGYDEWVRAGRPGRVSIGGLQIAGIAPDQAEEFFVYQWLLTARPRPCRPLDLTSIVILACNELPYTRMCIDSIRQHTDEPYELIVVDNGSTDGTSEWLSAQRDIRVIRNNINKGFPAAANQGLEASRGDYLLLLNNDTIVTTGWLRKMIEVFEREPKAGLVGPVSNRVGGEQMIPVGYQSLESLDGWAFEWGRSHSGQVAETDRLIGFCLMFRRELYRRIGPLDERFGIGCYEDDDYCLRTIQAGFRCLIAVDSFVHHFGSRTFQSLTLDLSKILKDNGEIFQDKWTEPASDIPKTETELQLEGTTNKSPVVGTKNKLSLCMIVRDNEQTIGPALASIRPYVDEIIVVDTGSKDRTPEICHEYGARVEQFPWCDDFATARNESLKYATGDWIFWMDSDDTIPPECGQQLRDLVDGPHPEHLFGYVMQVHCPGETTHDLTVVDHVKLFRNRADLRFEFRIHEQILPSIRRACGEVEFTNIYVIHSGSERSETGKQRKLDRDFRILQKELEDNPNHPFTLFNLGMTHADANHHEEAIGYLERCIEVSSPEESHLRKAYALLVSSLYQSELYGAAVEVCARGLELFPDDRELIFRKAMLEHRLGELDEAACSYRKLLSLNNKRHFASIDAGLGGFKARHNLALVLEDQDEWDEAYQEWERILDEVPEYPPALRSIADIILKRCQKTENYNPAKRLVKLWKGTPKHEEAIRLEALIHERTGNSTKALEILETEIHNHPNSTILRNERCRLLFETSQWEKCRDDLETLITLESENPSHEKNLKLVAEMLSRTA